MKKRYIFSIIIGILVLLVAVIIFSFSSESGEVSGSRSDGVLDFIAGIFIDDYEEMSDAARGEIRARLGYPVRKAAHIAEYTLLSLLVALFVHTITDRKYLVFSIPIAFSFLFAMCDELILQRGISGRSGQFVDVLIDMIGMVAGTVIAFWIAYIVKSKFESGVPSDESQNI